MQQLNKIRRFIDRLQNCFILTDKLSVDDFTYSMGYKQDELFYTASTPLTVNATVCNTGTTNYKGKRAAFYSKLYLHDSADFTSGWKKYLFTLQIFQCDIVYV